MVRSCSAFSKLSVLVYKEKIVPKGYIRHSSEFLGSKERVIRSQTFHLRHNLTLYSLFFLLFFKYKHGSGFVYAFMSLHENLHHTSPYHLISYILTSNLFPQWLHVFNHFIFKNSPTLFRGFMIPDSFQLNYRFITKQYGRKLRGWPIYFFHLVKLWTTKYLSPFA